MTAAAQSWRTTRVLTLAAAAAWAAAHPASPARAQVQPPPGQPAPAPTNGAIPPNGAAAPIDVGQLAQAMFQQDVQALRAGRTQAERDEAARRLVSRQSPEGRREIQAALGERPPPPGQPTTPPSTPLAAAKAVPDDPAPPQQYVQPLAVLLRADRAHTEAAATALAAIRTEAAIAALTMFVTDPNINYAGRLPAVRPMGGSPDARLAEALVNLVDPPAAAAARVDPPLRTAAADALAEMTQLSDIGRDPSRWRQWWRQSEPLRRNPEQFRAELLERLRRRRPAAGLTDVDALVKRLYQLAPLGDAKAAAARRVLDSPDAPVRAAGVRLVYDVEFVATGRLPDPANAPGSTVARLREMVRDPSAEVRAEAARVLGNLNNREALPAMLAQLAVEPDAGVRVAIAQAFWPIGDLRAVPPLVQLLRDPSLRVAITAAESLAKLGKLVQAAPPPLAGQVAAALVEAMDAPRAVQDPSGAGGELRSACAEALVTLQDRGQQQRFLGLLRLAEPPRSRRAALGGIGLLGDQNTANRLVDWLGAEPDPTARLAALGALKSVGTFRFAESVYRYTRPDVEPDESVRRAAWSTFVSLLPGGTKQELAGWADRVARDGRQDQRVAVLQVLVTKQLADGEARDAAFTRVGIAEAYELLKQPQDAIPHYQEALAYWQMNGNPPEQAGPLNQRLLRAWLAARRYPEAVDFANQTIDRYGQTAAADVAAQIATAAEGLLLNGQPRDAERLATEAQQKLRNVPARFQPRFQEVVRAAQAAPTPQPPR